MQKLPVPITTTRNCCRCGAQFSAPDNMRVCFNCRKSKDQGRPKTNNLTFRELQIAELIAQGKSNKEIAFQLILTVGTVKEYLFRIFRKVPVTNRTELAVWYLNCGPATQPKLAEKPTPQPEPQIPELHAHVAQLGSQVRDLEKKVGEIKTKTDANSGSIAQIECILNLAKLRAKQEDSKKTVVQ